MQDLLKWGPLISMITDSVVLGYTVFQIYREIRNYLNKRKK